MSFATCSCGRAYSRAEFEALETWDWLDLGLVCADCPCGSHVSVRRGDVGPAKNAPRPRLPPELLAMFRSGQRRIEGGDPCHD